MSPNGGPYGDHCDCPTDTDRRRRRNARVLLYVREALGVGPPDEHLLKQATFLWATGPDREPELHELVSGMTDVERERIIYNAHLRDSRRAADWWEEWQERDKDRRRREAAERRKQRLRKQAKAKLTGAELKALKEER